VLAAIGAWTIGHKIFADQLSATANPNRMRFYAVTLFYEWFLFVLVVAGVRRSGASVLIVLGEHWHSVRRVLRDIGIAAGFWIVAAMLLWIFGWLLRIAALGRNVSMLPRRGIELTLWIALSVTAGICEETIFRGYLQRQFMALTKSAPAGILLSAAAFGAAHAYQGFRMVILIQPIRSNVRDSGLFARKRSPWNDRSCVERFIERSARRFSEALGCCRRLHKSSGT
jgi:membrane protease YdiL (CAAX protease family)